MPDVRTVGVEEEFHLVDLTTSKLTSRAPELLEILPDDGPFVAELQRCVIESNSGVYGSLDGLRSDLRRHRARLVESAATLGIGIVAAGSVPLAAPIELQVTETPRYRRMLADFQLLAREQLICGTQVHVSVRDRDEAVAIAARVAPHLPTLLALSASSPFAADGSDTGYASARTLVWQRWPTAGQFPSVTSAAEYDRLVEQLIASDVITDPGMVYFDVRPSAHYDTLELRLCDSCPDVATIALIAGLFRALVLREADRLDEPTPETQSTLYRAAIWQAARDGLEADLIDVAAGMPKPAAEVIGDLIRLVRPQLECTGDWHTVTELADIAVQVGSSAARQRRTLRRRGRLSAVVQRLVAETAGRVAPVRIPDDTPAQLLHGYFADADRPEDSDPAPAHDEAVSPDGTLRSGYREIFDAATALGAVELRKRQYDIEHEQSIDGAMFRTAGESHAQVFALDVLPRCIGPEDWTSITDGATQRARALNAFVVDVYGEQRIVEDGVVPGDALDRAPGYRHTGRVPTWQTVRAHICGIDIVSPAPGEYLVLEDNLRVPSGVAFALSNRRLMMQALPEIPMPADILPTDDVPRMLAETITAAAPPDTHDDGIDIIISSGPRDSAWFDHTLLAEETGLHLATPEHLSTASPRGPCSGRIFVHYGHNRRPVNTAYVRMDEDMLLSSTGHDDRPLRPGILDALAHGRLALVNALGNGVGDDKAIYAYVPDMIRYYLGEEPAMAQVPTWVCADRRQRDHVVDNLDRLVVKPIDGFGGAGITIGPECTDSELAARRDELMAQPERFIAQDVVTLSTHPTFDGDAFYPHHVDLRVFVHLRPDRGTGVDAQIAPAALTRVAPAGSLIVNSSRGGGGKDTWIRNPADHDVW